MPLAKLLLASCVALFAVGVAESRADVLITVDKATQRMAVSVDGQPRYSWSVSTGRAGHETPAGSFTPSRLEKDHASKEWDDAPMPYSIFFTGRGHAIHGSTATRRLGRPASHGCVRLAPSHAAKLFALVQSEGLQNTKVVIRGDEPGSSSTRMVKRDRPKTRYARRAPAEAPYGVPGYAGRMEEPFGETIPMPAYGYGQPYFIGGE